MEASTFWGSPPEKIFRNLSPGVVHVWRAHLKNLPVRPSPYYPELSADERVKAERFQVPHLQNQFIVTRSILRRLLSHYTSMPAAKLRIESNLQGKPALADPAFLPLQFNVSHTSGIALLAFTVDHAVGIDVERIDRTVSINKIAARYFSPRESTRLMSVPPEARTQEFFTYWTCKEAYLKMRGIGMSGGLAQSEIVFDPAGPKAEVWVTSGTRRKDPCSLFHVDVGRMYIAALAVDNPSSEVSFWDWKV